MTETPLDRVLALAPSNRERLEISRLGAELGLAPRAEEWTVMLLYAEARRIFGPVPSNDDTERTKRLERVLARLETMPTIRPAPAAARQNHGMTWLGGVLIAILAWTGGAISTGHSGPIPTLLTRALHQAAWPYMVSTLAAVTIAIVAISRARFQRIR